MRAPVLGGNFGVWGGLFSTFDCAVKGIRKKEDPYNAIIAGFFTGGSLAIRGGYKAARNGAIGCAVLLAVIEGVGIAFNKMMAGNTKLEVGTPVDNPVVVLGGCTSCLETDDESPSPAGTTTATRQRSGHGMNERHWMTDMTPRTSTIGSASRHRENDNSHSLLSRATLPAPGQLLFFTRNWFTILA